MAAPQFIQTDPATIQGEIKAQYEALTGRTVSPGETEMFIFNAMAYRESLVRQGIQNANEQMLVSFSSAPVLDYLGELVGVTRLAAIKAGCKVQFNLISGHNGITIPAGLRVESKDGSVYFVTNYAQAVAAGVNAVIIGCECTTEGTAGNNYLPGEISRILDPQPYITTAANIETTAGGAEAENDERLRVRIKQAPASYSNAGSKGAYIYHAKTANPAVIDVAITSPASGIVAIWPLVTGGLPTPQEVLDDVYQTCNADKIRPLTDSVVTYSPERVDYALDVQLTLYPDAVQSVVLDQVERNLQAYALAKASLLGQDVILTQVIPACMVAGVYKVELVNFTDLVLNETQYAFCTDINVTITGLNNG